MKKTLKEKLESGVILENYSSLPAIDLLDFCKKHVINQVISESNKSFSIKDLHTKVFFSSERERDVILNYRCEKITLERLLEVLSDITSNKQIPSIKKKMMDEILTSDLYQKHMFNDKIKAIFENRQYDAFSVDYLVNLIEKINLQSKAKEIFKISNL